MKMAKNPHRYETMTMHELVPFVDQYYAQFPDWKRIRPDAFGRETGPVAQEIFFERLSYGAYRPRSFVRIFPARNGVTFQEFLGVKTRQVEPRQHEYMFPRVVEAMHREIAPSVDRPLIPEDVLNRFEKEGPHRSPQAHHLAALNAYLGHEDRGLYWCRRFVELVEGETSPWQECDLERLAFLKQLEQWIKTGEAKPRLEEVVQSERKRLKYV